MDRQPQRVLHLIDSLNMGGAETWLLELVRFASARGRTPVFDFLAAGGEKGIFDDEVLSYGCRIFYIRLDKRHPLSFLNGFRRVLRENSYLAIHDHQEFLSGWHFLFGTGLLPRQRVTHFHNPHYQLANNYGVNARRRMNLRVGRFLVRNFSTHILGTSGKLLRENGILPDAYPAQKVRPLYCAFDVTRHRGVHSDVRKEVCGEFGWNPDQVRIVLFAGRMDLSTELDHPMNHKNSRFAMEVFKSLNDPDARMLMAGENESIFEAFNGMLREQGLEEKVRLLGIRRDLPRLMLAADALLFPSRSEGMGMVAVEAQAAGLPVLASDQVPDEVVVLEELVAFMSLGRPFGEWAAKLKEMMARRLPGDSTHDGRWKTSPFDVEVCFDLLADCYVHGR
jgi:glycosyltransferase involved in cell wall biosynthesis